MNPNQEITTYLKELERMQSEIDDRRWEIRREMDRLECEDKNLADCFKILELFIEVCQRALAGEPIFIWAEIQRFKWELENARQRIPNLDLGS